jgi:hypothetical protein
MSSKDRLLTRVELVIKKTAAAILWKYIDPEGGVFYMEERRMSTTRSPFSGQSFTAKPVRQSLTDVAKELRSGDAKVKGSLWKYAGPSGEIFYCDKRLVGTVKSPITGKTFPAKPEKFTLSEVGKELKLDKAGPEDEANTTEPESPKDSEAKTAEVKVAALSASEKKVVDAFYEKKPAEGGMLTTDGKKLEKTGMGGSNFAEWKGGKIVIHPDRPTVKNDEEILRYMKKSIPANTLAPHPFLKSAQNQLVIASEILNMGAEHPAIKVITAQYEKVLGSLIGEDPSIVMSRVHPEIQELSETCAVVAKQLEERVKRF